MLKLICMDNVCSFIAMPCPFLKDNYLVWLSAASDVLNINGKKCEVIVFLVLVVTSQFSS